jgi:hypothetical protein
MGKKEFKCNYNQGGKCTDRDYAPNKYTHECHSCCLECQHAIDMDCTFVCGNVAKYLHPEEE